MSALLHDLLTWTDALVDGRLGPPVDGARFAVRLPSCAAVALDVTATGPVVTRLFGIGEAVATDRRLALVDGDDELYGWDWQDDVGGATLLQDGLGIGLLPSQARWEAGVRTLTGLVPTTFLGAVPPPRETTVPLAWGWLKVEAAYALAAGELDDWRARVTADLA